MKKLLKIFFSLTGIVLLPLFKTLAASAPMQLANPLDRVKTLGNITNLTLNTSQTPQQLIVNLILYALGFLGIFFVISLLYAGYQWMTSRGEKDIIEKAQARIKNSVIGVIIILLSGIILNFASDAFYKATCNPVKDYYCPSSNPNPTGECRTDKDCEVQFGSKNWRCDMMEGLGYGSCKAALYCTTNADCTDNWQCINNYCEEN